MKYVLHWIRLHVHLLYHLLNIKHAEVFIYEQDGSLLTTKLWLGCRCGKCFWKSSNFTPQELQPLFDLQILRKL
jgi:hypothetical protein